MEPPSYLMRFSPEIYAQEQERVAQRFEETVRLAEQTFVSEFARLVAHLTERLGTGSNGERQIFRDTVISNLTEFFERFKHLNLGSHEELGRLVEQAQGLVRGVTPQGLRDDDGLRRHVATQFSQVQATLDGLMVGRPRRRIIRATPSTNAAAYATDD